MAEVARSEIHDESVTGTQHQHPLQPGDQQLEPSSAALASALALAHRGIDYISDLMIDNCEVSAELLAFMDSHAIAALCVALRFNKRACHVVEDERRWSELLRLQCDVVKAKSGKGYVWSKTAESEKNGECARDPMIVTPTVRAFGCDALVDFLSLRSQIQHLTRDVHVVEGDAKTITRVDGRIVDFRPSDLELFYPFTAPYLDVYMTHCHEYSRALRAIASNTGMQCAVFAPLSDSVTELLPQVEAKIALQLARDTILTQDFGAKIAFVCSGESVLRAFKAAHKEMLEDVLGRNLSASRPELAANEGDNVVSSLIFYDWWLATRRA